MRWDGLVVGPVVYVTQYRWSWTSDRVTQITSGVAPCESVIKAAPSGLRYIVHIGDCGRWAKRRQ